MTTESNTAIQALLLDFDGVISSGRLFSEIYGEEFDIDPQIMLPFFQKLKASATIGQGDIRDLLPEVFDEWKWQGSIDELMHYWLNSDTDIDLQVADYAQKLRINGLPVYLATDQEQHKANFIWHHRNLQQWMTGKYVSCELGYTKENPEFFATVVHDLNMEPQQIIYFDDSLEKVKSAETVGINAFVYTDFPNFQAQIEQWL